jgi:hypothetical protein
VQVRERLGERGAGEVAAAPRAALEVVLVVYDRCMAGRVALGVVALCVAIAGAVAPPSSEAACIPIVEWGGTDYIGAQPPRGRAVNSAAVLAGPGCQPAATPRHRRPAPATRSPGSDASVACGLHWPCLAFAIASSTWPAATSPT